MANLSLNRVFKAYDNHPPVIRDVSLSLSEGEFCVFVGPSGCGKSTLLRMVAGLEDITDGELCIGNRRMNEMPPAKRGVAMVFQSYALYPHMSVYDNMAFGLKLAHTPRQEIDRRVQDAARILQLQHLLERKPKALSGGQRQRVAIGRAIVREPGVFLFDEPLSNLDAALRVQTRIEIARLHREFGKASTIYVTHDQVEAMTLADKIVLLNTGEAVQRHGSVAQFGAPLTLYHHPRNQFVAGFIGSPKMNFLPGAVIARDEGGVDVQLDSGERLRATVDGSRLADGARVTLGIRPEHLHTEGVAGQALTREVGWAERLGDATFLYCGSGDQALVAKAAGHTAAGPGERVTLGVPADACHLFDADGWALPRRVHPEFAPLPV